MYLNSLADALCQSGHQIFYQSSWDMKEIEAGITYFQPDALVTVGLDIPMRHSSVNVVPELCRKYRLLHIYWATEDDISFNTISMPFIQRVQPDIIWSIHPDSVRKYRSMGMQASYLNFAFNPRIFAPKPDLPDEIYNISFIGSPHLQIHTFRYDSLNQLLFPFIRSNIPVHVWGYSWLDITDFLISKFGVSIPPHCVHGYLPYKQTASIYRSSKIMLGVQNANDQVTQRTFEILGTGAFMIASRTEALEQLFIDREEIVLTSSPEETVELVGYYLNHPEERLRIGRRAREKVLSQHTYAMRLEHVWPLVDQSLQERRNTP